MTDSIERILIGAKRVSKVENNNLSCVVIADDENGIETNYTLNFNYDDIIVERTIVNNNRVEVKSSIHEYNKDVFLFVLRKFDTLIGDINRFNNTVNSTLNNIPAIALSNLVLKIKEKRHNGGEEEIYAGDKYIYDFIAYNNSNILINNNNYFTFLKITVEAGNIEIFDYLRFTYDEYINNLGEEQMAILIYTAYKRSPTLMTKMRELDFTFGFEVLKLAVDNDDYEVLEYLRDGGIDINTVNNRFRDVSISAYVNENYEPRTILDYVIKINNIEMIKYFLVIKDINIGKDIALCIRRNPKVIELFELLYKREDVIDILKMEIQLGWTVAHEIAENENPEVVRILFEVGDTINILKMENFMSWSVANVIADNKNPEVVKLLFEISREAMDSGSYYSRYEGIIFSIARNQNPEVVKLLFETKCIADNILELGRSCGYTIFHIIAENENPEVFKLLFEMHDIKNILKIKDKYGQTAINIIARNQNPEVIESLLACENIELEKKDIDLIKKHFGKNGKCGENEKIIKLLNLYKLNKTNNLFKKKETKMCTIC